MFDFQVFHVGVSDVGPELEILFPNVPFITIGNNQFLLTVDAVGLIIGYNLLGQKQNEEKVMIMKKGLVIVLILVSICSFLWAKGTAESAESNKEITVMVPPWAEPSPELLQEFVDETGISVVMNIVGWDDIRNKVAIAAVANTAPADVIEVDWSWTGEFGAADWFEPIELSDEEIADYLTLDSFTYDGKLIGLPYANDYRLGYYNTADFSAVGYEEAPDTWDEMIQALKEIKAAGIKDYPMAITLSATEAATTSFFWFTLSNFGPVFNEDFSLNEENALASMKLLKKLISEDGLIDPANINMKDIEVYEKFTTNSTSLMIGPTYFVGRIHNPELSNVVEESKPTLVPGNGDVKSASFALPEGIGVSKFSKNKEAAITFAKWYTSPEVQLSLYEENGNIPTRRSALQSLIDNGLLIDGDVMLEQGDYIVSPFPGGIPNWYAELSNVIYNNINKMAQGDISPEAAVETISARLDELRK